MTYAFQNGVPNTNCSRFDYVKAEDGRWFMAKSRKTIFRGEIEPHMEKVVVTFPNGRKAEYCANLNNGIATFIDFID